MTMWLSDHQKFLIAWTTYSLMLVHFPVRPWSVEIWDEIKETSATEEQGWAPETKKHDRKLDSTGSSNEVLHTCFASYLMCQLRFKPLTTYLLRNTSVSGVDAHGVVIKNVRTT
jgi:hypothetical protein